jgi:very-short-patch-repair endonuclease
MSERSEASTTLAVVKRDPKVKWQLKLGAVESPIEADFLMSFCDGAVAHGYRVAKTTNDRDTIAVRPQQQVERYRCDFVIVFRFFGAEINIVVEADGHEFHERTKWQASRDKARDRRLTKLGYRVLRFTGSEIFADARRCAGEVLDLIMYFQTSRLVASQPKIEELTVVGE